MAEMRGEAAKAGLPDGARAGRRVSILLILLILSKVGLFAQPPSGSGQSCLILILRNQITLPWSCKPISPVRAFP